MSVKFRKVLLVLAILNLAVLQVVPGAAKTVLRVAVVAGDVLLVEVEVVEVARVADVAAPDLLRGTRIADKGGHRGVILEVAAHEVRAVDRLGICIVARAEEAAPGLAEGVLALDADEHDLYAEVIAGVV
mgnify:CR=1 FL=1